jgi:signal peptidase I
MRNIRDILITIIIASVIFIGLQLTMGTFQVYGQCMLPNINDGDRVMVTKTTYLFNNPDRGDIVVFHSPRDTGSDLIKRVIGLPGDTIEIKNHEVFVNGKPLSEPYLNEAPDYSMPSQRLPLNQYFVLGDNRNNSADSHTGWFLPRENIIGKAWLSYWPPENWGAVQHYSFGQR